MAAANPGLIGRIGNYFLFGNVFIATSAFCLLWTTCLLIRFPLPLVLGIWVFLATFFLYNFDSLLPTKLMSHVRISRRKAWVLRHRRQLAIAVMLAGVLVLALFYWSLKLSHFWLLAHLAALSILYSLPVIPTRQGLIPLRNIPLLKIILIAYVWASVTVWLPLLVAKWHILAGEGWLLFVQRFLFILPLTIIFDIRDVERDKTTATLTLPRLLGVRNAKIIAFLILAIYILVVILSQSGTDRIALLLSSIIYSSVIWLANENRSEYFYAIAGDGVLVLPLLLLWLI